MNIVGTAFQLSLILFNKLQLTLPLDLLLINSAQLVQLYQFVIFDLISNQLFTLIFFHKLKSIAPKVVFVGGVVDTSEVVVNQGQLGIGVTALFQFVKSL